MIKLIKKYQLWTQEGCEGWSYTEFDTLEECLTAQRYTTNFMVTQKVDFEIKETNE